MVAFLLLRVLQRSTLPTSGFCVESVSVTLPPTASSGPDVHAWPQLGLGEGTRLEHQSPSTVAENQPRAHALLVEVSDVFFKYKVYIHCYSLYILSKFLPKPEQKNTNPHFKIIFPYYLRTKSSSYRISFYLPPASICCSICVFDWHIYCLRIWQFYHLK